MKGAPTLSSLETFLEVTLSAHWKQFTRDIVSLETIDGPSQSHRPDPWRGGSWTPRAREPKRAKRRLQEPRISLQELPNLFTSTDLQELPRRLEETVHEHPKTPPRASKTPRAPKSSLQEHPRRQAEWLNHPVPHHDGGAESDQFGRGPF